MIGWPNQHDCIDAVHQDLIKIRVDGLAVGPLKFVHHLYYLTENKKDHIHAKNLLRLKLHAILIERD